MLLFLCIVGYIMNYYWVNLKNHYTSYDLYRYEQAMNLTPAMAQYYELKEQCSDAILFFRMWDFYEMFDEDAHIAHQILWVAITTRNKNAEKPIPLAGIPFHAKQKYLPQLVKAWYKVALAEQVSDPNLKGIVKREIVRIVTPSTLELEGESFENNQSENYIVSLVEDQWKFGISFLDITSNIWKTAEFNSFDELKAQLYKISPSEVVLQKTLYNNDDIKNILEKKYSLNIYYFQATKTSDKNLKNHFWVKNLEAFGIQDKPLAIQASSLLLEYLELNQNTKLSFLNSLSYHFHWDYMNLDETTIKSLDLIYNFSTKSSTLWTLFGVLNKTKTSAGSRLLRDQVLKPLQSIEEIEQRQKFIWEFLSNTILLDKIRMELTYVSNIDSILNRLALNRSNPRDLLNLKRSLQSVIQVFNLIEQQGSDKLKEIIKL